MSNINTIPRQPLSPERDGKFVFTRGREQFYPQEPNGQRPSAAEVLHTPDPEVEAKIHMATAKELAHSIQPETKPTKEAFDATQAIETLTIAGIRLEQFYRREELMEDVG